METLASPVRPTLRFSSRSSPRRNPRCSIRPPPPGIDYKSEFIEESRSFLEEKHTELMDLAADGTLVRIAKHRFGPVPAWRTEFVEPEEIWLLGTSHLAAESASDVERVVRALMPDNVVVELCRSRAGIMYASDNAEDAQLSKSNMFSLSGAQFFGAVNRSINLGGQSALALRLLLAVFSSKISSTANRPFGDEFRAARKASEEVGAQIVLGDRPIEITLERAWRSLMWSEKVRFIFSLIQGITSPSIELPENDLKGQLPGDSPLQLYEKLSFSYPSLLQPLIHERDTYLAWSLKRSKAVNNCKRVVGIIGKGHMNGVIYSLISDQGNLRFRDLVGRTSNNNTSNGWIINTFKSFARDTILGFGLWALYEKLKDKF
ncbi:traB domain-containing protein isoform X2 [Dioscorea cayenensis subsp. rotundata]|uniref:TraB domain-containing protein isoform X2 n=1 Tax=Dioscorea cayennensis subsp. rotundata TaxID=55577 RepID=A0AB40C6W7_DIOCR|nr:traB domain-containing protein isoform X2 [Dioscorea cayenensis subsp. rotundata]